MMKRASFRILVVEDNPDHAQLVKSTIEMAKKGAYEVQVAASVEEAVEILGRDSFSLIMSDFNLPGKSGLHLLEWLNEKGSTAPFIMLTGSGDEKIAVKAMQEGAYNYVVKDESYLQVVPHVIDEALLKYLANQEKEHLEKEIREKNIALDQANRKLRKLDELKSNFTASVSHEIRTPLNSVRESLTLLLDGVADPKTERGQRVLEIARRNIDRLTSMINDLLDFSKIEAGKLQVHLADCNLETLLDEVVTGFQGLAQSKKIKLVFQPKEKTQNVYADAERVIQIITNLVNNAVKFTAPGGTITADYRLTENDMAQVTVTDSGLGIPKEDLERIFERFEQSEHSNQNIPKGTRGTGIGLSICSELIKMHHGRIWADSELGKGSKFHFTLPLTQAVFEKAEGVKQS